MKSDRPIEPQRNEPADDGLEGLAAWWRKNGSRTLIVVIAVVLVSVLIYQWQAGKREREVTAQSDLATARYAIDELQQLSLRMMNSEAQEQVATLRKQYADDARQAISLAIKNTKSPSLAAEASVTLGDLNWLLASLPDLPGATTRESLRMPQPSSVYLDQAAKAYQEVIAQHPGEQLSVASAYFGLAAISENRKDWAQAKKDYETIKALPDVRPGFAQSAEARLTLLAKLEEPTYLATPATLPVATTEEGEPSATTRSTTQAAPATTQSASSPSGQ